MNQISCKTVGWHEIMRESVRCVGYCVVTEVLEQAFLDETRERMYSVQKTIQQDLGKTRLQQAGEIGVLRLMMKYDPFFLKFLEIPEILTVVDHTVSNTAIMHLQNGFILPSYAEANTPNVFQNRFHPDFPRVLNGYLLSVNTLITIDAFTRENGGTLVVPGTHHKDPAPPLNYLEKFAVPVECPPGSMIVFDSTLQHAAGHNLSGKDRLGINHQFTRSYLKQQIDYVRALGEDLVTAQVSRTQQLLGGYTRVVTGLDEYYRPEEKRLYRKGQG